MIEIEEVEEDERDVVWGKCSRCGDLLTANTTPISDNPVHSGLCDYCAQMWDNFD